MTATPSDPGTKSDRDPAIRVIMMPKDATPLGTIFGGIILSYIDQAGAVEAHRFAPGRLVTVAMREVVFHEPVFVGDLVSLYAEIHRQPSRRYSRHHPLPNPGPRGNDRHCD